MPHIPRRYASTQGISPDLTTIPRQAPRPTKPPVPYHGSSPGESAPELKSRDDMVPKLSIRNWNMDPARIFKALFGKEAERDEYTGGLRVNQ